MTISSIMERGPHRSMRTLDFGLGAPQHRYANADTRKSEGAHYTPALLADFVAAQLASSHTVSRIEQPLRVLDPAVGDGSLIIALLDRLQGKAPHGLEVTIFDTSREA